MGSSQTVIRGEKSARHVLDVKMAAVRSVQKLYGIGLHSIRQNTALKATTLLQQRAFRVCVSLTRMNVVYNVTQ